MNTTKKIVVAALAGAAAGAIVALLFAPKSGSELRRQIADGAKNVIDDLHYATLKGKDLVSSVTSKASQVSQN